MMLTEEEAKTKWCPFVRAQQNDRSYGATPVNRDLRNPGTDSNCIASQCMAWRWSELRAAPYDTQYRQRQSETHGFCGLAGKP